TLDVVFVLSAAFRYDAARWNRVLEIRSPSDDVLCTAAFDAVGLSIVTSKSDASPASAVAAGAVAAGEGLVTQFRFTAVPEPGTLELLVLGSAALLVTARLSRRR